MRLHIIAILYGTMLCFAPMFGKGGAANTAARAYDATRPLAFNKT